jgi:type IV secretory pathway VirB4 component
MTVNKPTSPIKASTQSFIEIEEIKDDVVLMKDYSAVVVVEVGAVNFWLLSAEEQTSMIYSYAGLLNSLSFPVQILILSKKMDISSYLDYLDNKINSQNNPLLKTALVNYKEFIKTIVKKNVVLEKRFFFVIPFSPLELGISGANPGSLNKEYVITRAKTSLYPKRDNLVRLLAKTGLQATVLDKQALVELFYNLYNPSSTGRRLAPIESYTDMIMSSS